MPGTALDAGNCTQGQRQPCEDSYVGGTGPASLYVALGRAALKTSASIPPPSPLGGWFRLVSGPTPSSVAGGVQAGA